MSSLHIVSAATWYPGDLHRHTGFSTVAGYDGVTDSECDSETVDPTGYTVEELKDQVDAAGIHFWLSLTDHSYCLDSSEWSTIDSDASTYSDSNVLFLPSEEVSVVDDYADSVDEIFCNPFTLEYGSAAHLGAHGISSFIVSDVDEWCPESPTSQNAINTVNADNAISIINHPSDDYWDWESLGIHGGSSGTSGYKGLELWNNRWDYHTVPLTASDTYESDTLDFWKEKLLDGEKIYAYGGSDYHEEEVFPITVYNYAYMNSLTESNLKTALADGKVTVTNNGNIYLTANGENQDEWVMQGDTLEVCDGDTVQVNATYNVNNDCTLYIWEGTIGDSGEYSFQSDISGSGTETAGDIVSDDEYFRAECISSDDQYRTYTNPIWVEIDTTDADSDGYCSASDCDDSDSAEYPDSAETDCSDGKDNDCDGDTDTSDSDCGGTSCTCSSWTDVSCGAGSCSSTQMREERTCNPSGCNTEYRCVSDSSCSSSAECDSDETEIDCEIDPDSDRLVLMDISDGDAYNTGTSSSASVCGLDECDPSEGFAVDYNINDCDGDLDETMLDEVIGVELNWWNDGGEEDCSDTDLYYYERNEDHLEDAGDYERYLTNVNRWDRVENDLDCDEGLNEMDITDQFKEDLEDDNDDEIAYAWWPDDNQDLWYTDEIGDVHLDVDYCYGCTDDDSDGYGEGCDAGEDCNDANANINPDASEDCSDGYDNDCDGDTDCADSDCNGDSCGTCMICSGGSCSGTPSDDSACGTIDCSSRYSQTGSESATGTETCYNKEDITSNRCEGFGNCKDANTADCDSQSNDNAQYSCGTCSYISGSSCTGNTLGSCSYYGTATECDSDYECSDSSGGNNAYDNTDYTVPSKGFCDGGGQCDYGSSNPVCTYAEGADEGLSISSICVDGQSTCRDSCTDGIDNDGDGDIDGDDSKCILIVQSVPTHAPPILNSTYGTNRTYEDLTVYNISTEDVNDDPVKNIINWWKDDSSFLLLNTPFEGGSNSTWTRDYSEHTNGTVVGATFNPTGGHDGFGAYEFDADGDYINFEDSNTANLTVNFTISVWVKPELQPDDNFPRIIDRWTGGASGKGYVIYMKNDTRKVTVDLRRTGANTLLVSSTGALTYGEWSFITATYNGTDVSLYIDGVLNKTESAGDYRTIDPKDIYTHIGAKDNGAGRFWNGAIDDVTIWDAVLTAEQVELLFDDQINVIDSGLTKEEDVWLATVTPNDNDGDGETLPTNTLTIKLGPYQETPILNSTDGTNLTTEDLTVYNISTFDPQGDNVKNVINWYRNDTPLMVLNMPFEGGSDASFTRDYTNFGHNGTVENSPVWDSDGGYDGNGTYTFDGENNQYIEIPWDENWNISNFTVTGWIYRTSDDSFEDRGALIGSYEHFLFRGNGSGEGPFVFTYYNLTDSVSYQTDDGLSKDKWWHVVARYTDENNVTLFVNGEVNVTSTTMRGPIRTNSTSPYYIGQMFTYDFNGSIDDVQVYNFSLTDAQVKAIYENRTDLIHSSMTQKGDIWQAEIAPNDGNADGEIKSSNSLTIK